MAEETILPSIVAVVTLIVLGIGPFGMAYVWWDRAIRAVPVGSIAPLLFASPALGVVWLTLLGYDAWTAAKLTALALTLTASALCLRKPA